MKDIVITGGVIAFVVVFLFILSLATQAAGLWVAPWFANQQTQIQRNTINYTDTKAEYMLRLVRDYGDKEATPEQKLATLNILCDQVRLQPENLVPDSVFAFINRNGGCR